MRATIRWLAVWSLCFPCRSEGPVRAPSYTQASLVNAASNVAGSLAPNTIASLYGESLAYATRAIGEEDTRDGILPVTLRNSGTRVIINGVAAPILYASPGQINFLVPANLEPGVAELRVIVDALVGPVVSLQVQPASPALFQLDATTAIATHADGTLITGAHPGRRDEVIVLYATGLGQTSPKIRDREIPVRAASIELLGQLRVLWDGTALDAQSVYYAGLTPGYGGLYQINLRVPTLSARDPEVRISVGEAVSPPALRVPVAE